MIEISLHSLSIVSKFPSYLDDGVASLPKFSIYVADNSSPIGLQFACRQIGLPASSVRKIPTLADEDKTSAQTTIDLVQLQLKINEDVASNCTPLFLVLDLGASICGNVDDVIKIQELCQLNKIWLHLRGHSLAALSMQPENRPVRQMQTLVTYNL
jgi:Pyridoxal-dependent decarboxylase conserved domain